MPELWELPRFVDEVEQVRQALGLDRNNFCLLGQSWGGILATEYALNYQQHLKGLIISNMVASIPAYNEYAEKVLMPAMDQKAPAEIKRLEAAEYYENVYVEGIIQFVRDVDAGLIERTDGPAREALAASPSLPRR